MLNLPDNSTMIRKKKFGACDAGGFGEKMILSRHSEEVKSGSLQKKFNINSHANSPSFLKCRKNCRTKCKYHLSSWCAEYFPSAGQRCQARPKYKALPVGIDKVGKTAVEQF